jgi:diguanylate cyclase (GGDEF)-like protein
MKESRRPVTPEELLKRVEELEGSLAAQNEEISALRLQLDVLSTIDPPTGLLNRTGLLESVEVALLRLKRQMEPFALLLVKLPELNEIASRHGNSVTDARRHVTALLSAGLRALDRTARVREDVYGSVLSLAIESDVPGIVSRLGTLFTAAPIAVGDKLYESFPIFSIVLVRNGGEADAQDVLAQAEEGLEKATESSPFIHRI